MKAFLILVLVTGCELNTAGLEAPACPVPSDGLYVAHAVLTSGDAGCKPSFDSLAQIKDGVETPDVGCSVQVTWNDCVAHQLIYCSADKFYEASYVNASANWIYQSDGVRCNYSITYAGGD